MRQLPLQYLHRPSSATIIQIKGVVNYCISPHRPNSTHQTKRTDFGRKRGGGTNLTTSGAEVDDLDFTGILQQSSKKVEH
jgi:hypothetical protein